VVTCAWLPTVFAEDFNVPRLASDSPHFALLKLPTCVVVFSRGKSGHALCSGSTSIPVHCALRGFPLRHAYNYTSRLLLNSIDCELDSLFALESLFAQQGAGTTMGNAAASCSHRAHSLFYRGVWKSTCSFEGAKETILSGSITAVALTAAGLGAMHALLGPDHYVPFAALARAGKWSRTRTVVITLLSGLAHVVSSVLLAAVGIMFGVAAKRLHFIESFRGQLAAWALIGFGLMYFLWGVRHAFRNRAHAHSHVHPDGVVHGHGHAHHGEHLHPHFGSSVPQKPSANFTSWVFFAIFVFGPCEPMIPLVLASALAFPPGGVLLIATAFAISTLLTMLGCVLVLKAGLDRLNVEMLERYAHALAGAAVALCGFAIYFVGR
jgi:ABC-type nickel/cobalt efflux system permease component RcnA